MPQNGGLVKVTMLVSPTGLVTLALLARPIVDHRLLLLLDDPMTTRATPNEQATRPVSEAVEAVIVSRNSSNGAFCGMQFDGIAARSQY
jgi:hypothetical protein